MATKIGIILSIVCLLQPQLSISADVDWEILNFAISNPEKSNPEILKNAMMNILGGFTGSIASVPAAPIETTTTTVIPTTTEASPAARNILTGFSEQVPFYLNPIYYQQPQVSVPAPDPLAATPPAAAPQPADSSSFILPYPTSLLKKHQPKTPDCGPNKIGEFLVNVPCPKATPKPPREIVVKLPCPTTKKPVEESPCNCQSCVSCKSRPSKSPKKHQRTTTTKKPCENESVSDSHEESYESYHPRGKFQRIRAE